MKDLASNIKVENTLKPAAYIANETGETIDLRGYNSAAIQLLTGTITDGTHTLTIQESDDGISWNDVDPGELNGTFEDITTANAGNQKVGYHNIKRYLRVNVTVAGATTGGVYSVVVIKGHPWKAPVS